MKTLNKADLIQLMVDLELANEELLEEIRSFDQLMRQVGFKDGIDTIKITAIELTKNYDETNESKGE
jgi:hypothetical protein